MASAGHSATGTRRTDLHENDVLYDLPAKVYRIDRLVSERQASGAGTRRKLGRWHDGDHRIPREPRICPRHGDVQIGSHPGTIADSPNRTGLQCVSGVRVVAEPREFLQTHSSSLWQWLPLPSEFDPTHDDLPGEALLSKPRVHSDCDRRDQRGTALLSSEFVFDFGSKENLLRRWVHQTGCGGGGLYGFRAVSSTSRSVASSHGRLFAHEPAECVRQRVGGLPSYSCTCAHLEGTGTGVRGARKLGEIETSHLCCRCRLCGSGTTLVYVQSGVRQRDPTVRGSCASLSGRFHTTIC
mmetsp:Transcript_10668/g.26954  ORF Transcript_10668/g.26954 Transcript_10668/m.26954 type:complete len:297 (+) Transcript_10668:348-1238(+)